MFSFCSFASRASIRCLANKKYVWETCARDASFLFQVAGQEIARLRHGQGRREEDVAEEVAAERLAIESSRANGRAEAIQEEEREARLATGGESEFPGQGRSEARENLLAPDDRGGLAEAAGRVEAAAAAAAEAARAAPEVPQRRRGGVHLRRHRGEAGEDAGLVPPRRLLREHDVGRRLVGLGQAEGREEEAEEEEAAAAAAASAEEAEQRNGAGQARLQREDLAQQRLTIVSFELRNHHTWDLE